MFSRTMHGKLLPKKLLNIISSRTFCYEHTRHRKKPPGGDRVLNKNPIYSSLMLGSFLDKSIVFINLHSI